MGGMRDPDVPPPMTYEDWAKRSAKMARPEDMGPPGWRPAEKEDLPSLYSRYYSHMARLTKECAAMDKELLRIAKGGPGIKPETQLKAIERFSDEVYGKPLQRLVVSDGSGQNPERLVQPEAMDPEDAILFGKFLARGGVKQYETVNGEAQVVNPDGTSTTE